ncbi:unnamed protein product [Didymodactylos carnosus]|uniref:Uncharacterized protein n=1 Tax=Didymodactylos carnosus TaxID=1234261 RepID=A0A814S0R5_9BILA|nr:unnamed protein product [Didymodactylos carnosus]CAF3904818.1 unnamed protein product [Didymodactylos carnosus]
MFYLACAGAKVYLMGRDEAKLQGVLQNINYELQEKKSNGSLEGVICDINSLSSIKKIAQKFREENKPLNVLILKTGLMNFNYDKTIDGLELIIGVNHIDLQTGPPLNYKMLDDWNSDKKDAKKGWSMMSGYQQSQLANVLFARALTSTYGNKQITAYSVHYSIIKTNLGADILLINGYKLNVKNLEYQYFIECSVTIMFGQLNNYLISKTEWLTSHNGWCEVVRHLISSTNNTLEATNRVIKDENTLGECLPLSRLKVLAFEIVGKWSKSYERGLKKYIISKQFHWIYGPAGYQWVKLNKSVLSIEHDNDIEVIFTQECKTKQ